MIKPWCTWFRRRRHRSKPADRRARFDPWHRRPAFERVEDRWMLSGPAENLVAHDGFIDVSEGLGVYTSCFTASDVELLYGGFDDISHGQAATTLGRYGHPVTVTVNYSAPGGLVFDHIPSSVSRAFGSVVSGTSTPKVPVTMADDIEPIRLPADESSAGAPEEGLIDVSPVLNEPVGLACYQPAHRQESTASVGKRSDRIGSVVAQREGRSAAESRNHPDAFDLAASWGAGASTDLSPDHVRPASLRDSPFRPIEGARGLSQAFELATSGDESLAAAESPDGVPRALRFGSPSHEPVRSPQGPDRASSDQPSPGRDPSSEVPPEPSDRTLASVAERAAEAGAAREAVFAELAKPLGDALLNAVYVENKRATDLIPLLAVAALTHHLANRQWDKPVNDRIGVAYPRRRHPL